MTHDARKLVADAVAAYDAGAYVEAIGALMPLALSGDSEAQFYVYRCYLNGDGVFASNRLAVYWLLRSARGGFARAQERAGSAFRDGQLGLPHSYAKARFWFQAAAAQSNARALSQLGWMYFKGFGVPQNYKTALTYFQNHTS